MVLPVYVRDEDESIVLEVLLGKDVHLTNTRPPLEICQDICDIPFRTSFAIVFPY